MKIEQVITRRNLDARRIYIFDEIVEETAIYFFERVDLILQHSKDPIWILIHSCGGSVTAATSIVDEMLALQHEGVVIKTCALGMAYSAAAFILSVGTPGERYVRPSSGVMMHPVSFALSADYADMQERAGAFYKQEAERMNHQLAEACGHSGKKYKKFLSDIRQGLWLNAEDAIKYGVADKIWTGPLPEEKAKNEGSVERGIQPSVL